MTRAHRLLQLLELLRARRRPVPGLQLAEALGISLRTLYRDIASLRSEGAAIEGEPGIGYLLRPGFTLPPLMFSADELEALVLGARWVAHQSADPELARAAEAALNRITGVLPSDLRLEVETSGLFAPARCAALLPAPWLPTLRQAIRREHILLMDYRDEHGQPSQRRIWPFALAFFDETRLIAAWCELRQDFRHFRADRVQRLADTGQRYPERRPSLLRRWSRQQGIALD
ncbi:YafY family transcriptional regulator [Vandammella animalimorsus]|uniref:YafY family transcriptional regulator n=1 Tax=Vandammella animalimorsus TaxID=2029117 RepID=A0A3M6RKS3_9BURK|nr:YafY family protein [Vandammella animalimorsus]RMX15929.1 YafY family transcriptional regulator [Vandammella animalimorsus]